MHEFCPLCLKNGIKAKIEAFQVNFEEAIYLCPSEKCIWPMDCNVDYNIFIKRPLEKDGHDIILDFSDYTPPQTPGNEITCKDSTSCTTGISSVPSKSSNFANIIIDQNVNNSQDFSMVLSKTCKSPVDSSTSNNFLNNSIRNNVSIKPKVIGSKTVTYHLEKSTQNDFVFIKNDDNKTHLSNNKNRPIKTSTSLVSKSSLNLPKKSIVKEKLKNPRSFLFRKKSRQVYEKFDFNELIKEKHNSLKKVCKENRIQIHS